MKTNRSLCFAAAAFLWALLGVTGYAEKSGSASPVVAPSNARVAIAVTTAPAPTAAASVPTVTASVQWLDISGCTSEMRERFFAGLTRLEAMLNTQIEELTARRAAANGAAATAELDSVLNEMRTASFFLQLTGETLRRAPAQTWDQQKAKVGLAWTKSQEAYLKFKTRAGG